MAKLWIQELRRLEVQDLKGCRFRVYRVYRVCWDFGSSLIKRFVDFQAQAFGAADLEIINSYAQSGNHRQRRPPAATRHPPAEERA